MARHQTDLLHPLTSIEWECIDLPKSRVVIDTHIAQAAYLDGKLYIQRKEVSNLLIFDTALYCQHQHAQLWTGITCPTCRSAFTTYQDKLVLVGGWEVATDRITNKLWGLSDGGDSVQIDELDVLQMPTRRYGATVLSHGQHLLVAGGVVLGKVVNAVEVFNGKTWESTESLPKDGQDMSSAFLDGVWYLMGGTLGRSVFSANIDDLIAISKGERPSRAGTVWLTPPEAPLEMSCAAVFGSHLLAIGGMQKQPPNNVLLSKEEIYAYLPDDTPSWLHVGDLPDPVHSACSALLPSGELAVVAQRPDQDVVYMASLKINSFPMAKLSLTALEKLQFAARIHLFQSIGAEWQQFAELSKIPTSEFLYSFQQPSTSSEKKGRVVMKTWLENGPFHITWKSLLQLLGSSQQLEIVAVAIKQFFSAAALEERVHNLEQRVVDVEAFQSREEAQSEKEEALQREKEAVQSREEALQREKEEALQREKEAIKSREEALQREKEDILQREQEVILQREKEALQREEIETMMRNEFLEIKGRLKVVEEDFVKKEGSAKMYGRWYSVAERDSLVAERDTAIAERDIAVAEWRAVLTAQVGLINAAMEERDAAVTERDAAMEERDAAVTERDAAMEERDEQLMALVQYVQTSPTSSSFNTPVEIATGATAMAVSHGDSIVSMPYTQTHIMPVTSMSGANERSPSITMATGLSPTTQSMSSAIVPSPKERSVSPSNIVGTDKSSIALEGAMLMSQTSARSQAPGISLKPITVDSSSAIPSFSFRSGMHGQMQASHFSTNERFPDIAMATGLSLAPRSVSPAVVGGIPMPKSYDDHAPSSITLATLVPSPQNVIPLPKKISASPSNTVGTGESGIALGGMSMSQTGTRSQAPGISLNPITLDSPSATPNLSFMSGFSQAMPSSSGGTPLHPMSVPPRLSTTFTSVASGSAPPPTSLSSSVPNLSLSWMARASSLFGRATPASSSAYPSPPPSLLRSSTPLPQSSVAMTVNTALVLSSLALSSASGAAGIMSAGQYQPATGNVPPGLGGASAVPAGGQSDVPLGAQLAVKKVLITAGMSTRKQDLPPSLVTGTNVVGGGGMIARPAVSGGGALGGVSAAGLPPQAGLAGQTGQVGSQPVSSLSQSVGGDSVGGVVSSQALVTATSLGSSMTGGPMAGPASSLPSSVPGSVASVAPRPAQPQQQQMNYVQVWTGQMEVPERAHQNRLIQCCVLANKAEIISEIKPEQWPPKMNLLLFPKTAISQISEKMEFNRPGGAQPGYTVMFHFPPENPAHTVFALKVLMSNSPNHEKHMAIVQLVPAPNTQCPVHALILMWTDAQKIFRGFIPREQEKFVTVLKPMVSEKQIKQIKSRELLFPQQGMPGGGPAQATPTSLGVQRPAMQQPVGAQLTSAAAQLGRQGPGSIPRPLAPNQQPGQVVQSVQGIQGQGMQTGQGIQGQMQPGQGQVQPGQGQMQSGQGQMQSGQMQPGQGQMQQQEMFAKVQATPEQQQQQLLNRVQARRQMSLQMQQRQQQQQQQVLKTPASKRMTEDDNGGAESHSKRPRHSLVEKHVDDRRGHVIGVGMDIIAETTFVIGSDASTLDFKGCGVKLHILQNSLPADCQQCELKIRSRLSGKFKLQPNCELVSGVHWIQCPVKLTKAVTVEVQHYCTQTEKLSFVRASCTKESLEPYVFEMLMGGEFPEGSTYGSIELPAFSLIGIVVEKLVEWFSPHRYKAKMYRSLTGKKNTWTLYFTIIKELDLEEKVFCQILEREMMRDIDDVVVQAFPVKFEGSKIVLENLNCIDEWLLTCQLDPVILKETVDRFKGQAGNTLPFLQINVKFSGEETESTVTLSRTINLKGVPMQHPYQSFLLECFEPTTSHSYAIHRPQPVIPSNEVSSAANQQQSHQLAVFLRMRTSIQTGILHNIRNIAHIAFAQALIPKDTQRAITEGQMSTDERTDRFLEGLESKIRLDGTCLMMFVEVLRQSDPAYHDTLIRDITKALRSPSS